MKEIWVGGWRNRRQLIVCDDGRVAGVVHHSKREGLFYYETLAGFRGGDHCYYLTRELAVLAALNELKPREELPY